MILTPSDLRFAVSRSRFWAILTRKGRMRWTTNESLESLTQAFAAQPATQALKQEARDSPLSPKLTP